MTTHSRRKRLMLTGLLLLGAVSGARPGVHTVRAQTSMTDTGYRLASAQVVTATERPPTLKLSASGPIAFELLPADESGAVSGRNRVVARLYGVTPGQPDVLSNLAPFVVTVRPADRDSIVTIEMGGIPFNHTLVLRAGQRTSDLEAAIVTMP